MDITQGAKFFDRQSFDSYNFSTSSWQLSVIKGQLKSSDKFVSIWNRPTRKRMLYSAPGQLQEATVIRVPSTQEIFMVGTSQKDSISNRAYREITGLHEISGFAQVLRKTPVVVSNIKGWAVESLVRTSFADVELRSVNESQDKELINYGHFFLFMPSDEPLKRHDSVRVYDTKTLTTQTYYVLEVYLDSGYKCARVTVKPDERINFTYISVGEQEYDDATQQVSSTDVTYNVTGKISPILSYS